MSRALCVLGSVKRQDRWDLKSSPRSTLQVWNPREGWPFITGTKPSVDHGQTLRLTENIIDTSQRRSRIYKVPPMAPHSSTLAWKIPWMGEPGRLQSMGLQRVGHDWATSISFFLSIVPFGEGNGKPLQCSCLENPMDRGAWWAIVYGVAKSRTWLSN